MFVPLIIGAVITTICQGLLNFDLWETLGNPMKDMFSSSGQMLIIGLMLFCTGTQLKMSDIKDAMHRGVLLILVRLGVAYALCALFYALFGFYGESGFGEAQVMQIISLIIPFILGMILGNMDEDIRKVFAGGNAITLPFLGFEFGSTINLIKAFKMIPQGLMMSILYFIIVITPSYIFERTVLHRPGYASFAIGSLAGVALVIPSMAEASNTALETYVNSSVAILAFVLAITNILCPFMVRYILKKHPADENTAAAAK